MRTSAFLTVAGIVSLLLSGCGWFGGEGSADHHASGGVAVLDLDAVAKQLGRDVQMANSLQQRQQTLTDQLKVVQTSFVDQIEKKKQDYGLGQEGVELTDDETRTLLGMQQQAGIKLNQARQQAINNLGQHRVQLIASFRDEVKPYASKIATEKGLSLVVTKNDSVVFTHEDAVDITNAVAEQMKADGKAVSVQPIAPPAPAATPERSAATPTGEATQNR